MGRTTLTRTTPLGPYPTLQPTADSMDLALTAADTSNNNQILLDGPVMLVAHNSGGSAYTITITSSADAQRRTGDITAYSIGAGEYWCMKVDQTSGWIQSDGYLYLQASNVAVKLGAIRL